MAAVAQEWADSLIKRNPPTGGHRKREELQQLNLGENWYLAWSEGTPDLSAKAVIESWAEEEKWYNYDDNTCAPGKECLHYTQLVWSNTQRLGAGRAVRTTDDGRTYVVWVCNYAPAGNIRGERPYSVTQARGQLRKATATHDTIQFAEVRSAKICGGVLTTQRCISFLYSASKLYLVRRFTAYPY